MRFLQYLITLQIPQNDIHAKWLRWMRIQKNNNNKNKEEEMKQK